MLSDLALLNQVEEKVAEFLGLFWERLVLIRSFWGDLEGMKVRRMGGLIVFEYWRFPIVGVHVLPAQFVVVLCLERLAQ